MNIILKQSIYKYVNMREREREREIEDIQNGCLQKTQTIPDTFLGPRRGPQRYFAKWLFLGCNFARIESILNIFRI